jgi:hypothetical protein
MSVMVVDFQIHGMPASLQDPGTRTVKDFIHSGRPFLRRALVLPPSHFLLLPIASSLLHVLDSVSFFFAFTCFLVLFLRFRLSHSRSRPVHPIQQLLDSYRRSFQLTMANATSSFAFGLHRAASLGDSEGVKCALRLGADVNALDATGRTALMCAIAGDKYVFLYTFSF